MRTLLAAAGTALLTGSSIAHAQEGGSGCERAPRAGRAAVYGIAQDSTTRLPLQDVRVILAWVEDNGRRRTQDQRTSVTGAFRFCDAPADIRITLEALRAARALQLSSSETRKHDVVIDAPRSAVAGRVVDAGGGAGVADADVRVRDSDVRAVTRADGTFQLPDLPPGLHWLHVTHLAFQPRADSVRVEQGARMQLTIRLAETVIPLKPIEVQVRSQWLERAGFYDRQERGMGVYLTRREWEVRAPQVPSDLMRVVAGVRVVPVRGGFGYAVLDRSNCAFRYVLDGARVGSTFQMDEIPVDWIEAIEVYKGPSTVPAQFALPPTQARANCGVIVIWTRPPR